MPDIKTEVAITLQEELLRDIELDNRSSKVNVFTSNVTARITAAHAIASLTEDDIGLAYGDALEMVKQTKDIG